MWDYLEEREEGAAEGFLGRAVSWGDAIKFVAMGFGVLIVTYYSVYSMGETLVKLVGWIDVRSGNGTDCTITGKCDLTNGSALSYDLLYHSMTVAYSWFLYTFIIGAAHYLASD